MTDKKQKVKKCAHCQQGKPANLEHYYKDRRSKDGLGSWCIECQNLKNGAVKKIHVKEKKKNEKQKPLSAFPGVIFQDVSKTLVLNFSDHPDLFEHIKSTAKLHFRSSEMQAMWCLSTDHKLHVQGE